MTRFKEDTTHEYILFRKVAPHYDAAENSIAKEILKYSKKVNLKEYRACDLGCGTGLTLGPVLDLNLNIKIDCVDDEINMIEQAKISFENKKLKFIHKDLLKYLSLQKSSSMDIVFSGLVLHNCSKPYRQKTFKEIYRVLKPNGIFINMDKVANYSSKIHSRDFEWQMKMFNIFDKYNRNDLKKKWIKHYQLDNSNKLLFKESEQKNISSMFSAAKKVFRKRLEATYVFEK